MFGLKQDCTHQDIKEAFYRLSKLCHPDVTNDPSARAKFQELARAYEVLGNPQKRKDYDRGLVNPSGSTSQFTGAGEYAFSADAMCTDDNFSSFYVKHYNRALNEAWFRQCDPEIIKTALEYREDKHNFVMVVYMVVFSGLVLGFFWTKLVEKPIRLIEPPKSEK
ncbi:Chaperone protein DnaJ [Fasciola hepatica]|uniref:Chaperone protein DnaJ n=1 Tax=Fasciola hepatica TaxID=6192 RepID=A0A4E0RUE8_FASHE|nr:Chaperone protein DnaJ [Fasciola hepatica]